jgi:hypothetical protein
MAPNVDAATKKRPKRKATSEHARLVHMQGPDGDAATLQWLKKNNSNIYAQAQVEAAQAQPAKRKRPEFKRLVAPAGEDSDGEQPEQTHREKDADDNDQAVGNEEDELSESEYEPDKKGGPSESDEEDDGNLVDEEEEGIEVTGSRTDEEEHVSGACKSTSQYGKAHQSLSSGNAIQS